jgi:outer membrane protein insertion porin family
MTKSKSISIGATVFKHLLWLILFSIHLSQAAGLQVEKIIFNGNTNIKNSELKSLLKTKEGELFDNKLLRLDKTLLQNYYQRHGFLNVWIESQIDRHGNKIDVIFNISEGRQYRLGKLEIEGIQSSTPEQARKIFNIKDGEIFKRQQIEEGLNRLETYYFNHGKPYVILNENQSERDSLVFVTIQITENTTVHIRDIQYIGLDMVRKYIVRREMEVKEGDLYSRQKIEESQRNIYSTGLFDYVGMELQTIDSVRANARLLVKVVEKDPRWIGLRFGVAYEQETVYGGTFDFTLEFGHRNLFGSARTITANVIPSISYDFQSHNIINPKNQYSIRYIEPWIGYTRTPGLLQISFYQIRPLNSADYNYFTSSFQVRHEFGPKWKISGELAYNQVHILGQDTLSESFFSLTRGQEFIYSISTNLLRDSRDNYMNPREGSVIDNTFKIAYSNSRNDKTGKISTNRFIKLKSQWNRYQKFPLNKKWVLATRIKGGGIFELGKRAQIPLLERFFLGGASSVRGYQEQLLGPVSYDASGRPVALGGKVLLLGNIELRIPLFWLFVGEVFTDGGNVWAQYKDFNPADIKTSSGFGLALLTPLGPIRFDYGFKHFPEKGEDNGEFHIGISFAF